MKFQVAKQDLDAALKAVGSSLSGAPDLSGHFLFRRIPNVTDRVELRTYSGRLYSGATCVAVVDGDDASFTVEGKRLKSLMGVVDDCVLSFDFDGTVVTVSVPDMGDQTFESLNPDHFPHWDDTLKDAKVSGKLPVERLVAALSYCRPFIAGEETKVPNVTVCEIRQGILYASIPHLGAGVYLTVPSLNDSTLRIQVKDLGSVLSFLGGIEGDVEIRETDNYQYFMSSDGRLLGESKYSAPFPKAKNPPDSDQHWWKIDVGKALRALPFLKAGADQENEKVRVVRPNANGPLQLQMLSRTGKMSTVLLNVLESGNVDDAPDLPAGGFGLGYDPFLSMLNLHREDETITLGITLSAVKAGAGYVRVVDTKFSDGGDADKYVTIIAWLQGVA